jgi:tetratricopeptide (TPR) repeat protein
MAKETIAHAAAVPSREAQELSDESLSASTAYGIAPERSAERIFTFYSYKGGVGRSLAMWNVACVLADSGRRVLLIDADLEAPGLSMGLDLGDGPRREGFLELAADAANAMLKIPGERAPNEKFFQEYVDKWCNCVTPVEQPSPGMNAELRERLEAEFGDRLELPQGEVGLVRAAATYENYPALLARLPLDKLYQNPAQQEHIDTVEGWGLEVPEADDLTVGELFVRVLRNAIWEVRGRGEYDYVLIDSRTGFADVAGMCVQGLPDRLVVLFGLNKQNIQGTAKILETLPPERRTRDRLILVASPLPNAEADLLEDRLGEAAASFGQPVERIERINYYPRLALEEMSFTGAHRLAQVARDYRRLTSRVRRSGGDTARDLIQRALEDAHADELLERAGLEEIGLAALAEPDEVETALASLASRGASCGGDFWRFLTAIDPENPEYRGLLGIVLIGMASELGSEDMERARATYRRAEQYLERALELEDQPERSHHALGTLHRRWAGTERECGEDGEARDHLEEAFTRYERALEIKEDSHEAAFNWGHALADLARLERDGGRSDAARELFGRACGKYERALEIKEDTHQAANNWGGALVELSRLEEENGRDEAAAELLEEAAEKVKLAESIRPGSATYNLACIDARLGRKEKAIERLREILPDDPSRREHAAGDPDLESLHGDERFEALLREEE